MAPPDPVVTARPPEHAAPPSLWRLTGRQLDYWLTVYRRTWRGSVFSSFLLPVLYVASMGLLLGGFVDEASPDLEGAASYLAFVAPGLVAAQAMQTAANEGTWPVMGMIKWQKIYFSMIATPLTVPSILLAHVAFVTFRIGTTCGVFLVVLSLFGVFASVAGVVAAFFVQLLVGLAFTMPLFAFAAGLDREDFFSVIHRLLVLPMFLFSGAFFPVSNLPTVLEWLAKVTPLWHGVDLTRGLTLGTVTPGTASLHVAYLAVFVVVGWWFAVRRLTRRLVE